VRSEDLKLIEWNNKEVSRHLQARGASRSHAFGTSIGSVDYTGSLLAAACNCLLQSLHPMVPHHTMNASSHMTQP
jgi:hypothetical protein